MRKALIVGINHYDHIPGLNGCVGDADSVRQLLDRNADGSVNFSQPRIMTTTGPDRRITRAEIKKAIEDLFSDDNEIALFFFAGHGHIEATGGYVLTSDAKTGDDGLSMSDIMLFVSQSRARNKIVILDCCHSGAIGNNPIIPMRSDIPEGTTILTASTKEQYALENGGGGVFTGLLADALSGAAADILGRITPGSIYAHIDQSLGSWSQRPVFKTNVKNFVSLRQVAPAIPLADLRRIIEFFPAHGSHYRLSPSYEPTSSTADEQKTEIFEILQKYNRVNLLVPNDESHMYYAAMASKTVRLTATGEHYRRLVSQDLI